LNTAPDEKGWHNFSLGIADRKGMIVHDSVTIDGHLFVRATHYADINGTEMVEQHLLRADRVRG
jgi:hypothetical protein